MICHACGEYVGRDLVNMFDFCPRCNATPFEEAHE